MARQDRPEALYNKLYLPPNFACGFVCFELRNSEAKSVAAMAAALEGRDLRGYFGGLVLRAVGQTEAHSARVQLVISNGPVESINKSGETPLREIGRSDSLKIEDNLHIYAEMNWSESFFAGFAFDLIAMMRGTYSPDRPSSAYGRGNAFVQMMIDVGAKEIKPGTWSTG